MNHFASNERSVPGTSVQDVSRFFNPTGGNLSKKYFPHKHYFYFGSSEDPVGVSSTVNPSSSISFRIESLLAQSSFSLAAFLFSMSSSIFFGGG